MKKIIAQNIGYHKFAFYFDYNQEVVEFCRLLKNTYGYDNFSFYGFKGHKAWIFSEGEIIAAIKGNYPDTELDLVADAEYKRALDRIKQDRDIEKKALEIKQKDSSDIVINGLKLELKPHQKVGVEFFINNRGRAILADQMGSGKTAISLAYVVKEKLRKVLVVCPASVKFSWADEVAKFTNLKSVVINGKTDKNIFSEDAEIFIINYDILSKFKDTISEFNWDAIICDEFHMIKDSRRKRTKAVRDVAKKIPRCLLLSGTPLLNKPIELFNGLNMMDPKTWNSYNSFALRYCGGFYGPYGIEIGRPSNLDELQGRIQKYFLRRTKDQILKDLPPKVFTSIPVELADDIRVEYNFIASSLKRHLSGEKQNEEEDGNDSGVNHLAALGAMRQLTTRGKIESAKELIANIVGGGEKVVVFSNYIDPLNELMEEFKGVSVMLTGQTPVEERKEIVEKFQNDDNIKIFFGGIKSSGVGITLTAGTSVVFIDYSWVPADHLQAIDRIHRIGQTASSVSIYQLFARDTIDEMMKKILEEKQIIFDQLIEGKPTDDYGFSVAGDLLSMIKAEEIDMKTLKKKVKIKK
jgi:SWI/SNF-related matrix-associated actin-dependent regulator of chromatin subfamily A-like protein 1